MIDIGIYKQCYAFFVGQVKEKFLKTTPRKSLRKTSYSHIGMATWMKLLDKNPVFKASGPSHYDPLRALRLRVQGPRFRYDFRFKPVTVKGG